MTALSAKPKVGALPAQPIRPAPVRLTLRLDAVLHDAVTCRHWRSAPSGTRRAAGSNSHHPGPPHNLYTLLG